MSDLIYSRITQPPGYLASFISSIYQLDPPNIVEFHGAWGSVAISRNLYCGFQPLDEATHLHLIIGGPILTFTDNRFLTGTNETLGSRLILERVRSAEGIKWDRDLSGPFVVLIIDKTSGNAQLITDMMSFIPVYSFEQGGALWLGTHVDALAKAAGCDTCVDAVSVADYVLSGAITFPHTLYAAIRQVDAATIHAWRNSVQAHPTATTYWKPTEERTVKSLAAAAHQLHAELQDYVNRVTEGMERVACFVSGGEDSRAVLALLPRRCERDAFVFLDSFNREGRIAKKCAAAFDANFKPCIREPTFYLDIFEPAARLMGSTWEPRHAHTFQFHRTAGLTGYPAVFGGYLSDSLVKGHHVKKLKVPFFPLLPQIKRPVLSTELTGLRKYFPETILEAVRRRRHLHYERMRALRPKSASEWFTLWPMSMRITMASFHTSRRLIRTYEPFMAAGVIKIAAGCPQRWKLNRRVFHRATQLLFQPVKWLPHSDGRLPYFSWINIPAHGAGWAARTIEVTRTRGEQGAWTSFETMEKTSAWAEKSEAFDRYVQGFSKTPGLDIAKSAIRWPIKYKLRLLQILQR